LIYYLNLLFLLSNMCSIIIPIFCSSNTAPPFKRDLDYAFSSLGLSISGLLFCKTQFLFEKASQIVKNVVETVRAKVLRGSWTEEELCHFCGGNLLESEEQGNCGKGVCGLEGLGGIGSGMMAELNAWNMLTMIAWGICK
jgi:hypothetical protein